MNIVECLKSREESAIVELLDTHMPGEIVKKVVDAWSIHRDIDLDDVVDFYEKLREHGLDIVHLFNSDKDTHPINVMVEENKRFFESLESLSTNLYENESAMSELGALFNHFNRKEKLFLPLFERKGIHTFGRIMWRKDDEVRNFYKGLKKRMARLGDIEERHILKSFEDFKNAFLEVIRIEELLFLPLAYLSLSEKEMAQVQLESSAYPAVVPYEAEETRDKILLDDKTMIPIGAGFLSVKELDLILNNLPLEITFINENGIFKYFNDMVEAREMMFVRTPLSIGRMVSHCHPPNSVSRVMQLIRDLKSKKKSEEVMWFKKNEKFVYVTYKALFDEEDKYMGILEYVQDIAPIFELERSMKKYIEK